MAETTGDSAGDTSIGALLRASRMRIGEDLRDVAHILRIRHPYLEAIEESRISDLPGQAYAVGFVRAYAGHLGLDGEEVVRRFKEEAAGGGKSRTDLRFPTPVTEASVPGGAIVFIGLLIAILAYGGWYVSTSDENYLADLVEPIPERFAALISRDSKEPGKATAQPSSAAPVPAANPTATSGPAEPATAAAEKTPAAPPAPSAATAPETEATAGSPTDALPDSTTETASGSSAEPAAGSISAAAPGRPAPATSAESETNPAPTPALTETAEAPATPSPVATAPAETAPAGSPAPAETPAAVSPPSDTAIAANPEPGFAPESAAAPAERPAGPVPEAPPMVDPAPAAEAPPPKSRILVRAKSNSWIQIQDDFSNEILVTRLLRAGEEYHVPNKFGLRLLTGNAGALEILVNGKPVPPIGEEGAVRRGVQLDAALLKAGQAVNE